MRHPTIPAILLVATASAAALIAGCSHVDVKPAEINPTDMPKGPGLLSGESGNILDAFKRDKSPEAQGGNLGVSVYMWRAALQAVSFMPIITADSQGGVITTDWYTPPEKPTERVRANVLITSKTLRADGLKVTLFKQVKVDGAWKDTPEDPATTRALEDAILTKARTLKVQSLAK